MSTPKLSRRFYQFHCPFTVLNYKVRSSNGCTDQFIAPSPSPGIWLFRLLAFNSRPAVPESYSNAPHVRPLDGQMPHPWGIFYRLTGQELFKTIYYKYQLAFSILKLDKGISYLHSKASLSFYSPFLVSHSLTNATSCLLKNLTFSLRSSERSEFPTFHGILTPAVKFPTPGEREGVKYPWYARGGGVGGNVEVTNWSEYITDSFQGRQISFSEVYLCPIILQLSRSDHHVRFENEAEIWGDKLSGTKSKFYLLPTCTWYNHFFKCRFVIWSRRFQEALSNFSRKSPLRHHWILLLIIFLIIMNNSYNKLP